jgi:cytochrome c biogenesis protein CcdA
MHQGRHIFFHFLDDCSIPILLAPNLTNLVANVATTAGMVVVPQASLDQLLKLSPGWTLQAIILIIIASGILVIFAAIAILKVWKNHHLNSKRTSLMIKFEKRWKEKVRPSMTDYLFQLYKDLRITSKRFYEEYKENDFIS